MDKSTFLYFKSKETNPNQCASCRMFLNKLGICSLHGKDVKIEPTMSCNYYLPSGPAPSSELEHVQVSITPKESGLINEKVSCERCEYYDEDCGECLFFKSLNIESKIDPHGCCTNWTKEDDKKESSEELKKIKLPNNEKKS